MDEESILKSLTVNGDGILQTLDGLSQCGKIFFYSCVHLLEKPLGLDPNKHKNTLNTFKFLSENNNISVSKIEVLDILGNFVDSKGCLINKKKKRVISMANPVIGKKPRTDEEEWLTAYKSQCQDGKTYKS